MDIEEIMAVLKRDVAELDEAHAPGIQGATQRMHEAVDHDDRRHYGRRAHELRMAWQRDRGPLIKKLVELSAMLPPEPIIINKADLPQGLIAG